MSTPKLFPLMLIRSAGLPFQSLAALAADWKTVEKSITVGQNKLDEQGGVVQAEFDAVLAGLEPSELRTAVFNCRKGFFQRKKLPSPDVLKVWKSNKEMAGLLLAIGEYHELTEVWEQARTDFRQQYDATLFSSLSQLQDIAVGEEFQRALLFSSHSLLSQLPGFSQNPLEKFTKKERQVALSVLQYAGRMACKTVPLSRLTTVSIQEFKDEGNTENFPFGKTLISPNVALLEVFYSALLREPAFYQSLQVRLNPAITGVSRDGYNWLFFNGETESFQQAESSGLLDFIVELFLENQQLKFDQLLASLQEVVDAEPQALESHVWELLELGFLEWLFPEPGLSANWCSNLYQYLGFLPAEPLIVEMAALLQWLRNAARALPYQSVSEARQTQLDTRNQLQTYFEKHRIELPPIPVEQLFYEDVEQPADVVIPRNELEVLLSQLADCWHQRPGKTVPESRTAWFEFIQEKTQGRQSVGFLELCREFLSGSHSQSGKLKLANPVQTATPIGALLQPFRENNEWKVVVNGLFPGGGKLFARWLPLFSRDVVTDLKTWLKTPEEFSQTSEAKQSVIRPPSPGLRREINPPTSAKAPAGNQSVIQFPWQGYFNANFQPQLVDEILRIPGGRVQLKDTHRTFHLGDLEVSWEDDYPVLQDRRTGKVLVMTDLGLEAPQTRPPVMHLLWQLAVPYISLEQLLPENLWQTTEPYAVQHRPRFYFRNLVLARAAWSIEPAFWQQWLQPGGTEFDFFEKIRKALAGLDIPRHFFAKFGPEQVEYFDSDSPIFMTLFHKKLRKGEGRLSITEMLPVPEERAQEIVCEFRV